MHFVTLSNGSTGVRALLPVTASAAASWPDPQSDAPAPPLPIIDFVSSNNTLDRFQEIIEPEGWRLDTYRRNPVFQNAHQYGDILFTLGKALVTEIRGGALFQRIEFAVDANPIAKIAYRLYRGKFLNAVSVGFIPVRWENGSAKTPFRRRYLEQELLEVSAVGIPANPDALQLGFERGAIDKADLLEAADLFRNLAAGHGAGGTKSPETICRTPGQAALEDVLRFAREIHRLLKSA